MLGRSTTSTVGPYIRNTLMIDKNATREEALIDIYRVMRPGEPPTLETAEALFKSLFFDPRALRPLGGRPREDELAPQPPDRGQVRVLRKEDILAILKVLVDLKDGRGEIDDIDHLGNRRVRSVGELMENQYRVGLLRMERAIRERMSSVEIDTVMPHDLINAKPAAAAVREFFGSSQLSQFMDQTNPLSRDHAQAPPLGAWAGRSDARARGLRGARRASDALRPHLPDRDAGRPEYRPDQQPRDLCARQSVRLHREPVPPRQATARSPTRWSISRRWKKAATPSPRPMSSSTRTASVKADLTNCRKGGDFVMARPQDIDFIDVSPKQLVSVAAALIPFLENDDANRALMGSNMQRQAVPLIRAEAPLVGTGMEETVARDSAASPSSRAAPASSIRSTARASSSARPRRPRPTRRASTSTICSSSSARTRTPASPSVRW